MWLTVLMTRNGWYMMPDLVVYAVHLSVYLQPAAQQTCSSNKFLHCPALDIESYRWVSHILLIRSHTFARLWSLYSWVHTPRKFWWGCEVCFLKPRPFIRPNYVVFVSPFHISNIFFKRKVTVEASQWCQNQDKILPFFSSKQLKSGPNFKPRRVIYHTIWYLPVLRLWSISVLRE